MATIKEIKGNVRFAIVCAVEGNFKHLIELIGEDEAEWMGETLRNEFIKKGLNEINCTYAVNKRGEWFDNKTEELINEYKILTYDVYFFNDEFVINKGFKQTYDECKDYIDSYNGTDESYFEDFKGGYVYIKCEETGEFVYEEPIPAANEVDEDDEMHLKDFSYIYKMLEDEIEDDGVELEEGEKPSVLELLNYYLSNGDCFFYSSIFEDYGECGRDVTRYAELTENEKEQIEELRRFCKE